MNAVSGASTPVQPTFPDLRPALSRAFDQAEAVIADVTPDRLTWATPCTDWDVRELLTHLVLVARRVAAIGEGRSALTVQREPIPDGEVRAALHAGREAADRAWADDAAMARVVVVPWGQVPGGMALAGYVPEVVTHTWDLWTAIDSSLVLDRSLAETALGVVHRAIPAAREGFPFGAVVAVPEDADAYSRLAGWMGRDPGPRLTSGAK